MASRVLNYEISHHSGYTVAYHPSNILVDQPDQVGSRWTCALPSTDSATTSQAAYKPTRFITLKLDKVAIVKKIGFGKYCKPHPCNLQEMSIYGGLSPKVQHMELLLHGGLKNDSVKESFDLDVGTGSNSDPILPVRYICIDAISAHSQNYNVAIWHVWLEGVDEPALVNQVVREYESYQTRVSSHLILSHLRRSALLPAFQTLSQSLPEPVVKSFENPLLSSLFQSLVMEFNLPKSEEILDKALKDGLFDEWDVLRGRDGRRKGRNVARWTRVGSKLASPSSVDMSEEGGPEGRGGHQMVRSGGRILLFGGWNGRKDLNDLWAFTLPRARRTKASREESVGATSEMDLEDEDEELEEGQWRCLMPDEDEASESSASARPKGKSCHQMAVDEKTGWVYLLGAFRPPAKPAASAAARNGNGAATGEESTMETDEAEEPVADLKSDFWVYKPSAGPVGKWELLSSDTATEGGPPLLSDHAMCVDSNERMLYVFGGKNLSAANAAAAEEGLRTETRYGGMWSYDLEEKVWAHVFENPPSAASRENAGGPSKLVARMGHAMILDPRSREMFVMSGQRRDEYLSDLWRIQLISTRPSGDRNEEEMEDEPKREGDEGDRLGLPGSSEEGVQVVVPWRDPGSSAASKSYPTVLRISQLSNDTASVGGPVPVFTMRVVVDPTSGEWTTFGGFTKEGKEEKAVVDVWQRRKDGTWAALEVEGEAPEPRYASQAVYHPARGEYYIFGGNPNRPDAADLRLGDLWRMNVQRSSPGEALRRARFLLRRQKFAELCATEPSIEALMYLQTAVSAVVNHADETESAVFRGCMIDLLSETPATAGSVPPASADKDDRVVRWNGLEVPIKSYEERYGVYEKLMDLFPDAERSVRERLVDLGVKRGLTRGF